MSTVSFNTHVPGYEVIAELGRGNARVLKARHLSSGDVVAIKQYAFATDADTLRRFERESQIMTQIDHPNIVRVREVHLDAALPYVVMDFVEGGDLRGLLRQQGHLDVPTTIRLGLQLTGALRAIHPRHVIHRDIKPENVLYRRLASGELHFLLTDFGIAKLRADESARTRTGQSLMTYEYAAPEQFDNPRQVNEAADYYALGVVLYECLTGKVPFVLQDETGLARFMQQVLTAPMPTPVLLSGQPLPSSLATLLTSLLVRNPADRLQNTNQLELLLEQSRVEQLKANWSIHTPPTIAITVAGPVVTATYDTAVANEPEDVPTSETVSSSGNWWWAAAGVALAIGLAFGLYNFMHRQPANVIRDTGSTVQPGPDSQTTPDSALYDTESAAVDSNATGLNDGEDREIQVTADPTYQISVDSSASGEAVPDSVATMPPDSAQ
ncbi:serine/threonine-protein kinase [Spirosoma arcticum]